MASAFLSINPYFYNFVSYSFPGSGQRLCQSFPAQLDVRSDHRLRQDFAFAVHKISGGHSLMRHRRIHFLHERNIRIGYALLTKDLLGLGGM